MKKLIIRLIAGSVLLMPICASAQNADSQPSQKSDAGASVAKIEQIINDGQDMLASARSESNVSQIDCINAQLIIARGFLNVAQNASTNLDEALSRNDQAAAAHHQKLLSLAVTKADAVDVQIKQCRTGVISESGETNSTTTRECKIEPCLEEEKDAGIEIPPKYVDSSPYL